MIDALYDKINTLVLNPEPSESEVDHLMTLTRKIQERRWGARLTKYPLLRFFVSWTKHATLSENTKSSEIILALNNILYENRGEVDVAKVKNKITDLLSFSTLKQEMGQFLAEYDLPKILVDNEVQWHRFETRLLHIIADCPLELQEKKYSKIDKSIKDGVIATDLRLTYLPIGTFPDHNAPTQLKQTLSSSQATTVSLVVNLSDNTHIKMMFPIYYNKYIVVRQ